MAGGSLYVAGKHLGHRTPSMTARYAHLSPEHMQEVAALTLTPAPIVDLESARDSVTSLSREKGRRQPVAS